MRTQSAKQNKMISSSLAFSFVLALLMFASNSANAQQWTNSTDPNNINNTNSGNVGIGTSTPSTRLEITKSGGATLTSTYDINNPLLTIRNTNATNNNYGGIGFGNSSASTWLTSAIYGVNETHTAASTGHLEFFVKNAGTFFEALRITAAGKVGIGINAPVYSLDVNGGVNSFRVKAATTSASDAIATFENSSAIKMIVRGDGNVGIGTTSPTTATGYTALSLNNSVGALLDYMTNNTLKARLQSDGTTFYFNNLANGPIQIYTNSVERMRVDASGNVGIGVTNPNNKLHVGGSISVDGNINAKYQDVAEWVLSTDQLAVGTVVVLDSSNSNHVVASTQPYDIRVAGVVSSQPGITLGEKSDNKVLVATVGRVRVKVDATRGPIHIGDLLVTSDNPGVAMKSEPVNVSGVQLHRPGTLIGKALEGLAQGQGEILVLLSLQ